VIFAAAFATELGVALHVSLREEAFPSPHSGWVIGGIVTAIFGLLLRVWAVRTLGRFFTFTVKLQDRHRVVSTGPYRLLRHPAYTGSLCTFLGAALALGSWVGVVLVVLLMLPAYLYRISVEERAMNAELGSDYERYQARTWRLVPLIF